MDNIAEVSIKNVYGVDKMYPLNKQARLLAELAGTRTLTDHACKIAEEMGFKFKVSSSGIPFSRYL